MRKKKVTVTTTTHHSKNVADHFQNLQFQLGSNNFVRGIHLLSDSSPCAVLYTDDQIQDMTRFCFSRDIGHNTIIGIDKTFNLRNFHVTVMSYKNLSVLRKSTNENPIFIGPMFIHGNSTQKDFNQFFNLFESEISESQLAISKPIFGTDDETAMRKSVVRCFPGSSALFRINTVMYCT